MRINVFLRSNCFLQFLLSFFCCFILRNSIQFSNCASIISFKFFISLFIYTHFSSGFFSASVYQSLPIFFNYLLYVLYIHNSILFSSLFIFWTVWCQETSLYTTLCVYVVCCMLYPRHWWDEKELLTFL